ncbi:MAG: NfeD family protein [Chloroflexota bacterium]
MKGRLIYAVVTTLLEEVALVAVVLWVLPKMGIRIPLLGLGVLVILWLALSVFTFIVGNRALLRKPLSITDMTGSKGKVVSTLTPEGMVRIQGECWIARASGENIDAGAEIVVVKQDGLKLIVEKIKAE